MLKNHVTFVRSTLRRFSALALFAGASSLALRAQAVQSDAASADTKPVLLLADNTPSLAALANATYSSSSSSVELPVDPAAGDLSLTTGAGMQPPPRRRYGRPRYNDNSHNADGSPKYTFVVGAGFTAPVGDTYHYLNTNYAFQVGGGRNFNKNFGVLVQFDYDRFGFNGRTLYNQESLYNYGCSGAILASGECTLLTSLDGNSHVWSFSLDPVYTLNMQGAVGAYIIGGAGFYHKVANFTTPEVGEGYSPYYGLYEYESNVNIDHYTSNAPGFSGGFGLTYKASRFSGERLFVEGRYVIALNSQRTGLTANNINTTFGQSYAGYNYYPENSNRTTYTVYKAGIRF